LLILAAMATAVATALGPAPAEARPRKGNLYILSTTTGAEVLIDGKHLATVPYDDPVPLTLGKHTVLVRLRGYSEYKDTIEIVAGDDAMFEADLVAHSGILIVETPGVTAKVLVDGKALGHTPFDGEVTIGDRTISVEAPGYHTFRTRLTVKGGQMYPIPVELEADARAAGGAVATSGGASGRQSTGADDDDPWYGNWWVWAGAGAVVVGATAVAISGAADEEPAGPTPHHRIRILEGGFQ
jgi:hypothetical protein